MADFEEELSNGLTVVCGLNGVGKTTLLRMLEAALSGSGVVAGRCRPDAILNGSLIIDAHVDGESLELPLAEEPTDGAPAVVLLDAFESCARIINVRGQPNFGDLLEGVDAREYTADERKVASYVVGRQYDDIRVYEIEEPGSDDDSLLPVFEVASGDASYSFDAMGLGELAALVMLWYLERLDSRTIVLIEEPETFLSSRSTVAMMNVLAERIHSKELYAIVTTHSLEIVARVPLDTIRVLATAGSQVSVRRPNSRAELEHILGAYVGQPRFVLVEDDAARLFMRELLSQFGGIWGEGIEVVAAGGVGPIRTVCLNFPKSGAIRLVGVLDADQAPSDDDSRGWPVLRLPGTAAPDAMFREAAMGNLELFSARLGRETSTVVEAAELLAGRDAHDWFPELARALMLETPAVARAAIQCWMAAGSNEDDAREAVDRITQVLLD